MVENKNRKNEKTFWNVLLVVSIFAFVIVGAQLASIYFTKPLKTTSKTNQDIPDLQADFFDTNTVYYLEAVKSNSLHHRLIDLLFSEGKDKATILEEFDALDLDKNESEENQLGQYLLYKPEYNTVYTYLISHEKIPGEKTILLEIRIAGNNPVKPIGIYYFEKKIDADKATEFQFLLKYHSGRYDKEESYPRSYKYLDLEEHRDSESLIFEALANGIQKTVNQNPKSMSTEGNILNITYTHIDGTGKRLGKPLESQFELSRVKKNVTALGKTQTIDTFKITIIRKVDLKKRFIDDIEKIYKDITKNTFGTSRTIDVFKNGFQVKNQIEENIARRIFGAIDDKYHNSFEEMEKNVFKSKLSEVRFFELENYIKEKRDAKKNIPKQNPDSWSRNQELRVKGSIALFLLLLCIILFFQRRRVTKNKPGLWNSIKRLAETNEDDDSKSDSRTVDNKLINDQGTKMIKESPDYDEYKDPPQTITIEMMREELIKIKKVLQGIKNSAINDSFSIDNEVINQLAVAQKKIDELITKEEPNKLFKNMILEEVRRRLLDFKQKSNYNILDQPIEKVEALLKELIGPDLITNKKSPLDENDNTEIPPAPPSDSQPDPLVTKGWNFLKRVLWKFFGHEAPEEKIDQLAIDLLNSPEEIKMLIEENKKLIESNKTLTEDNQDILNNMHKQIVKVAQDSRSKSKLLLLIELLKQRTSFSINEDNAIGVIKKVINEQEISLKYQHCAISLYDNLMTLKKKYEDRWFWKMLEENFLETLTRQIEHFKMNSKDGRTIYERILKKDLPLRGIEAVHIREIVELNHWPQIWDGVIRMSDFFNAYFDNDFDDIKYTLGHHEHQTKRVLTELGYGILEMSPLTLIPHDYRRDKNFTQINKAYIEKTVLPNLFKMNCKKLFDAVENTPIDQELVIYVERLGLIDKLTGGEDRRILDLRIGAYNKGVLKAHFSSGGSTRQNVKDQA